MISKNISNRKAQSQIISTVILILLVLATATIIFSFVIPFVRDKLSSGNCLDVLGQLEIDHNPKYTCYEKNTSGVTNVSLKVEMGDIRDLIEGFNIELGGVENKIIKITNGTEITGVSMYDGSSILKLPETNGATTYIIQISEKPDDIKIYSVLNGGKTCPIEDSILGNYIEDC